MSRRLAKLHKPCDRLDKYDNEPYMQNPLLNLFLSEVKERRHYTFIQRKAAAEKVKICRRKTEDLDDVIPKPESYYADQLREHARRAPVPKMLTKTEDKILSYVPKRLRQQYPQVLKAYMADVHEDFDKVMKAFSCQKIFKPGPDDYVPPREKFEFKRLGRTANYKNFLKHRASIQKNLLIPHPFIRCIIHYSYTDFPAVLNDYTQYRMKEEITLNELRDMAKKELQGCNNFIAQEWYPKVTRILKKHYERRTLPKSMWPKVISCASNLINRQLTELKLRTIDHLRATVLNVHKIPQMKIITICDDGLDLFPSLNDIFSVYQNAIEDIAGVGSRLEPLENMIDAQAFPAKTGFMKVSVGEITLQEAHDALQVALEQTFETLAAYLRDFQEQFAGLISKETRDDLDEFLSESRSFEEYLEKIEQFQAYQSKIKNLVMKEYFYVAIVNQSDAIGGLRKIVREYIERIASHIAVEHRREGQRICKEFEEIKDRALEIPTSTEQLMANGEYMTRAKTEVIEELRERIQASVRIGTYLLELIELPPNQMDVQMESVNWYFRIPAVFDVNSTNYEAYKFQFEEKLQEVTKQLNEKMEEMIPNIAIINDMTETEKFRDYVILLQGYIDQIFVFEDYVKWINKEEVLFKFPKSQYPVLEAIKTFIVPFYKLIRLCMRWLRYYNVWMDGPFEYLEPHFVESKTEEFLKEFQKTQKYYRNRIKADMLENTLCKFKGQTEDPDPEKHPCPLKLCARMTQSIKDFHLGVYIVNIMCNPALKDRHWDEMSEIAGFDLTPDAGTTLRKIINYKLEHDLDKFEIISIGANKELQLQQNLASMIKEWESIEFKLNPFKDTGINILSGLDEIQSVLDDHILKTLAMRGSAFVKPCEKEVKEWYKTLTRVNKTIEQWGKVQSTWLYLLPIFSSADIVAQMPNEGRMFQQVDKTYRMYMKIVEANRSVMNVAAAKGVQEALEQSNELMEEITNGVNEYLEKKRLYFPRFFFLSNDEMLEILSETKDPLRVQPHLSKCFEGINRLEFDKALDIRSMFSIEKEQVHFVEKVSTTEARGSVEKWLLRVEEEMLKAVMHQINASYESYKEKPRDSWVLDWPGMVVLCVSQIYWAANIHACLGRKEEALMEYHKQLQSELMDVVKLIRSKEITNLDRITIKALIVIDVHGKDVVDDLIKQQCFHSENDFQWLAQLRYYWSAEEVTVKIINASVKFACEYLGNSDRLVITPLTDRCYRTLMGAYQLHLNGAPEGPAGTGKTETTKDLAKALAVQCKVFNCSDGLDYKAMGKFFKGLASSGAWACFDEFNRIELEVLSVVAQQILCIIVAVRAGVQKFIFEGTELTLNPACYVCITMNPGYAGRSELPDNLKVLFRTVAMMVPDYAMIGEISLYSFGFTNARSLAVKIVTTYRLCSEQLSSQNHYDYGMRAVKTVLQACGNLKKSFPDEDEEILLLRSLIDVNLPKFLRKDVPLFDGIISDLFPGVDLPQADYTLLTNAFNDVCRDLKLQPKDSFLTKVIQTYEMMIVRHGFMMVGHPFSGKSMTLKVLAECLTKLRGKSDNPYFQKVRYDVVNPKAITMGQLYGAFDPISYEWTDGISSTIFRGFAIDSTPDRKWLIFDGPVDAVWIENMNTVLDDNKKLCLTSGEVITMTGEMTMIFEVQDLEQASPATVSRCGMIFMEPSVIGWEAFVKSWIQRCNKQWTTDWEDFLLEIFRWVVPDCLTFLRRQCKQYLYPGDISLLTCTMNIFQMIIDEAVHESPDEYGKFLFTWFQAALMYSVVWGLAGLLDMESKVKFDEFYREIWKGADGGHPVPEVMGKIDVSMPGEGMIMDYVYHFKQKGSWRYYPDMVRQMKNEVGITLLVPTLDSVRYMHIIDIHVKNKKPLLMVGPTGTGKTYYFQNYLMSKMDQVTFLPTLITFTSQITANQTQELIISKLIKKKRGQYGPPDNKTAVLFLDDMNMPAKEIYGAQPPIELIRQYFDYSHWYDLKDASKLYLQKILVMAACGLPGGSRQNVYERFLCHFDCFAISNFNDETMFKIFTNVLLDGYKKGGHATDVTTMVNMIVNATLDTYQFACVKLLPTPAKSHYIFNLRDVSRVISGCSMLKRESVESKKIFPRLWMHEAMRVFFDRLVDDKDRLFVFDHLNQNLKTFFKEKPEQLLPDFFNEQTGAVKMGSLNNLMFGSYFDVDAEPEDRKYEETVHVEQFRDLANRDLAEYNSTHKAKMDIVLFQYALQHLNKICRIMSMPGGSCMLVGMGGSGRQSLTKLAAQICGQSLFQPEITKYYGLNEWREDLKKVLKEAGGMGRDTVFLLTEAQLKEEIFLQDIDCLLNIGEVPNIYPVDEKQEILEMVRLAAQGGNRNLDISPLEVFQFFVNRCKQKLHIVICFSPIGSALRTRIRLYPSLVNCCTIDWFDAWPEDALEKVAEMYMKELDVEPSVKESIVVSCKHFHVVAREVSAEFTASTGRVTYITSASYLELIKCFRNLTKKHQTEIMENKMRYLGGLEKLDAAADAVSVMQKELNALQPTLIVMAEQSRKMTAEIEKESIEAAAATEQVKKDEIVANVQAAEAQVLKADCEKDLAGAIPILEEAIQALNTLKPNDITLVKSMKNPPEVVKLTMAAVCVMKGIPADKVTDQATGKKMLDFWGPSKRLLGDMAFLQTLKDFDKDTINPDIMKKIRKEFIPHKDFQPHIVAKASSAAEGLCKWIIAMDLYDAVAKIVAPKKEKLKLAEKEYAETMALLNEKRQLAANLERRVAELNDDLDEANRKKQEVEEEVQMCKDKLQRAETLIGGLGGEKSRWTVSAENLQLLYDNLAGDILVSSGVIAYLAPLTTTYRNRCIENWHSFVRKIQIPCSETYSLVNVLGSKIKIQNWNIAGLPTDAFSTENGIIMDSSSRYSLFIDPQFQANKWIRNMERNNHLQIFKFSQSDYMKRLESCIEHGYPALIENVFEDLEAPLDPLLNRNTFFQGGTEYLSLGDNVIPISPKFRLYLTSGLRNPHYLPEVFNKVTIINFALTIQGLEDQLLGIVVAKERPDLQEIRQSLILQGAKNVAMLKEVEDKILKTLSESKGDILEDESAIKILDDSKRISIEIVQKQEDSKEIEAKIEAFRQSYRPVAAHSSTLYYCITELPNIDPMYQFSLNWFINLYIYSIENANRTKDLTRRLKFLMDAVTLNLYNNVCRSLFEKDKLLFSFVLTTKIMISCGQIDQKQFQFLLTGGEKTAIERPNPDKSWITEKLWGDINRLEQLAEFTGFVDGFLKSRDAWKHYYDVEDTHVEKLPSPWQEKTNRFEKLIVLCTFRPDKAVLAITEFVASEMGQAYVLPPPFDIARSYEDSNCLTPLIFILSPGADPMNALLLFAEKMGFDETFQSISLGQGQGPIAQKIIERAQAEGTWVCLQNCHLAASWMPTLEYLWENMDLFNTISSFRLWLTSYPSEQFPGSILQNGIKMTNEPPTGLQQNLLRSYKSEPMNDDAFYTGCAGKDRAFSKLLYGICFFHAVVQERRKFGPLGWNIQYGFNESDFQISVLQLQLFLNQYDSIPYKAISYLTGECNYGGRVTDAWDRRAIVTILADYVNDRVVNDPNYRFSNQGDCYGIPLRNEHREYVAHIRNNVPNFPSPAVYGLHPNAGITRDLNASKVLLESMMMTQGGSSETSDADKEKQILAVVDDIHGRLPPDFDVEVVKAKYPVDYNESMNTVLVQEMERFNNLLQEIRSSCVNLKKGIAGLVVLTPELEAVFNAIGYKKIPDRWMKKSYPSLKPIGAYINDFLERLAFLESWYQLGKPNVFWISGFYFTQAFLTAAMQNYARKYRIPIDILTFDFNVLRISSVNNMPEDGVYIHGLFLEGAKWNLRGSYLEEQLPKMLADVMPIIHLSPVKTADLDEGTRYKCPVYKTAERKGTLSTTGHSTNYVIPILLGTRLNSAHWVKRSVALLCQTSE
ncbi:ciliary dynein heavy chain 11 [Culex quinquefasciatus]|uniref:Ciliary dynein heavy chain 11 n=1 Tax=Culex quinquefasciatus TaxID=7176 RepID=B0W746_CULQU|nr:ciliary dynein heavy chain 11 [Culex quinquefasciatus]|eukprot:XP_001844530.1 ciliary dynein heavy chain 11 [Culex quinquefasciatus]